MTYLIFLFQVAAAEFLVTFRMMTSDPCDELWKMSSKGEAGKLQDDERRWRGSRGKLSKQEKKLEPLKHATEVLYSLISLS